VRAKEFLFEYKRDITAQKFGTGLLRSGKRERKRIDDVNEILAALEDMDPTPNKQYMVWLANQYISGKFRLEDSGRIQELLTNFGTIKSRLPEKDIGKYDLHSLEDTIDRAMGSELGSAEALSSGTFPVVPDSEVLYNGPLGQLAIPETKKASCELGSGTKWCTAAKSDNMFTHYNRQGPLYIWRDKDGSKYQFHFPSTQFMDRRDRRLSTRTIKYFRTQHPVLKKLFALIEKEIAKDPELVYNYAEDVIKGRFLEGEAAIAKDPELASEYARHVIRGRFPEAEAAIAKDPYLASDYARYVIRGRWPEVEAAIAKDPYLASDYARYVIRGRFSKGEAAIAKDPYLASEYARYVIRGRFPEGEAAIAKDPYLSYEYARYVIKGRFSKGEAAIAKDPRWAYAYARDVIRGRFPEAEPRLRRSDFWNSYMVTMKTLGTPV